MSDLNEICANLKNHIIGNKTTYDTIELRDSNFRQQYFKYNKAFSNGGDFYSDICKLLTNYIIRNKLVLSDGTIKCDTFLRNYCNSDVVSFFILIKQLRLVIQ